MKRPAFSLMPALLVTALALSLISAAPRAQEATSLDGRLRVPPATKAVCWTEPAPKSGDPAVETCVPLAVLQVTFLGWKEGAPTPAKTMLDLQRQWAAAMKDRDTCQSDRNMMVLNAQQQILDTAMAAHAPAGTVWDLATQAYISPAPKAPDAKTPAKKSGG